MVGVVGVVLIGVLGSGSVPVPGSVPVSVSVPVEPPPLLRVSLPDVDS